MAFEFLSNWRLQRRPQSESGISRTRVERKEFRRRLLEGQRDFTRIDLRGADLRGLDLRRCTFYESNLEGCDLSGCDASEANFSAAVLDRVNAPLAWFLGVNGFESSWIGANLSRACLMEANLVDADLTGANLSWADLRATDLARTRIGRIDFHGANLDGTNLTLNTGSGLALRATRLPAGSSLASRSRSDAARRSLRSPAER